MPMLLYCYGYMFFGCLFAEYGQSLKERTRECEKLTGALEKQQDSALRKLNDLNETYGKERLRYESTIDRLEKNERELFSETEKLQEVILVILRSPSCFFSIMVL